MYTSKANNGDYKVNKGKNYTIFIHSLFRAGSTYLWNKFRVINGFCCYYEPLNEILCGITSEYEEKDWEKINNHPKLTKPYFQEYYNLINERTNKIPFYKSEFSYGNFSEKKYGEMLKNYFEFLINNVGYKEIPVFKCVRSALRVSWFKREFPNSIHIYLVRNPYDQWESFKRLYRANQSYFIDHTISTAIKLQNKKYFNKIKDFIEILPDIEMDEIYELYKNVYTEDEAYLIFYFTWYIALIENIKNKNIIINMDKLTSDDAYKNEICKLFNEIIGVKIIFDDCKLGKYSNKKTEYMAISHDIENKILKTLNKEHDKFEMECILSEIEKYTDISIKNKHYNIKKIEKEGNKVNKLIKMFNKKIKNLEVQLNEKDKHILMVNNKRTELNKIISDRESDIEKIYKSNAFKIGKIMVYPLKIIKKMIKV